MQKTATPFQGSGFLLQAYRYGENTRQTALPSELTPNDSPDGGSAWSLPLLLM